jgi:uncharacterized protein (TIGR02996 family)
VIAPLESPNVPISSDEEALLAAIAAAPDDDAPRLVYADWLQERDADTKAEYLRAVVRLLHPPEEPAVVARCLDVAQGLDADWRQQVGARFEVVVQGSGPLLVLAHLVTGLLKLAFHNALDLWQSGQPVVLRRGLTREDAEQITRSFGLDLSKSSGPDEPILRMTVRPMGAEPPPVRIALPPGPAK